MVSDQQGQIAFKYSKAERGTATGMTDFENTRAAEKMPPLLTTERTTVERS